MMVMRWWARACASVAGSVALVCAQSMALPVAAWAVEPPTIDPGALPENDTPGPAREMRQHQACSVPVVIADPDVAQPAPVNVMLNIEQAWKFSTGHGVTVALIDTGVTPNPRFPNLFAGGDYIEGLPDGGLTDCDSHGTIVASIIGAAPSSPDRRPAPMPARIGDAPPPPPEVVANPAPPANPPPPIPKPTTVTMIVPPPPPPPEGEPPPDTAPSSGPGDANDGGQPLVAGPPPSGPDGVVGIAPDARLISIRQSSRAFAVVRKFNETDVVQKAGDILSLARAVRRAADLGAQVINISVAACVNPATPVDQSALGAAIRYAAVEKDAVIVAAAGNQGENQAANTTAQDCGQNAEFNALNPDDPRDWRGVRTIVTPAWFSDYVLTVGAVTPEGQPMPQSIAGPWVSVAAPGYRTMGLASTNGAAVNALPSNKPGMGTGLWGTSFSAAAVSGVAALVRARFPQLSAHQVIERIVTTAHHPARGVDNAVGAGVVDAVAALTFDVAPGDRLPAERLNHHLVPSPPPPPPDRRPMLTAVIGAAVVVAGAGAVAGGMAIRRRMR